MTAKNLHLGKIGENYALNYLIDHQFEILGRNFHCRWGEIDLIAKKDNKIIFFEVKTRTSNSYGQPYEAVNYRKLLSLKRSINYYLLKNNLKNFKLSLKIIAVFLDENYQPRNLKIYDGPDWR